MALWDYWLLLYSAHLGFLLRAAKGVVLLALCDYWLLLQNKMWTADRILKHGGQANAICQLCRTRPETMVHMMTQCFSKQIWMQLEPWTGTTMQPPPCSTYRPAGMVDKSDRGRNGGATNNRAAIYIVAWNIWKERCRMVYDNKAMSVNQLISIIKSDTEL
jgi:hypothetical protein